MYFCCFDSIECLCCPVCRFNVARMREWFRANGHLFAHAMRTPLK